MQQCEAYFTQLFDSYTYIADNVTHGCNIVLSGLRGHVSQEMGEILEANFIEDEVEKVMFQFSNDKSHGWDVLTK